MKKKVISQNSFFNIPRRFFSSFSVTDFILIGILLLGIFLRLWRIENTMIFFADAGRDMLAAVEMNRTGEIPLLGIPSSVPRFKQGPLFVWFSALIFSVAGPHPLAVGYIVAFGNCLCLLFCYWLVKKNSNTTAALVSTLFLAVSPLAVAHSRMPYHITPIIGFLLLYLWSLQMLIGKKKGSVFIASLCFALLFQFELALFPLVLLIPFCLWRTKNWQLSNAIPSALGLILGLIPQIIFDLTHRFAQLGGFALWLIYRVGSFFWLGKSHSISANKVSTAWEIFIQYFSRIFSLDIITVGIFFAVVMICSLFIIFFRFKTNTFLQSVAVGLGLLLLAFLVHGTPSEAYFPPIILLSCIVIGAGISQLPSQWKIVSWVGLGILSLINSTEIVRNNFFSLPTQSEFQYGVSFREQSQIMKFIAQEAGGATYQLKSTDPDAHFESYLDNYRMIGIAMNQSIQKAPTDLKPDKIFYINAIGSDLVNYPVAKTTFFPNAEVIEIPIHE